MMTDSTALYIHIPFCRRRCAYCSFTSFAERETDIPAYVEALVRELALYPSGLKLSSVYFGGGTPSLLSADQLGKLLSSIHHRFKVDDQAEISIEANPGTVDEKYLSLIRSLGINRLSLGVQSLYDGELTLLGRIHTADEAVHSVHMARHAGFDNINLDVIYGIQGRSKLEWLRMLEDIVDLEPEHLSLYPLTLDGAEPLCRAIERGEVEPLDLDEAADQYEMARYILGSCGYKHYEISNWSRLGQECRHNMTYWQMRPYIGAGVAAHSFFDRRRRANTLDLDSYLVSLLNGEPPARDLDEYIEPETELAEAVILGFRLTAGVEIKAIDRRYGVDLLELYGHQISDLLHLGLINCDGCMIKLTDRGMLMGNRVFASFLPDKIGESAPVQV